LPCAFTTVERAAAFVMGVPRMAGGPLRERWQTVVAERKAARAGRMGATGGEGGKEARGAERRRRAEGVERGGGGGGGAGGEGGGRGRRGKQGERGCAWGRARRRSAGWTRGSRRWTCSPSWPPRASRGVPGGATSLGAPSTTIARRMR